MVSILRLHSPLHMKLIYQSGWFTHNNCLFVRVYEYRQSNRIVENIIGTEIEHELTSTSRLAWDVAPHNVNIFKWVLCLANRQHVTKCIYIYKYIYVTSHIVRKSKWMQFRNQIIILKWIILNKTGERCLVIVYIF